MQVHVRKQMRAGVAAFWPEVHSEYSKSRDALIRPIMSPQPPEGHRGRRICEVTSIRERRSSCGRISILGAGAMCAGCSRSESMSRPDIRQTTESGTREYTRRWDRVFECPTVLMASRVLQKGNSVFASGGQHFHHKLYMNNISVERKYA